MDKKELTNKLDELKSLIKTNSKDAHFADKLLVELLTVKGQIDHEPTLVHIPQNSVASKFESDTFTMAVTDDGTAIYKVYGGYTIVVDGVNLALRSAIAQYADFDAFAADLSEEEQEILKTDIEASAHVLNIPMIAFADVKFKYKLAKDVIKYLVKLQNKHIDKAELQPADVKKDAAFREGIEGMETLMDIVEQDNV